MKASPDKVRMIRQSMRCLTWGLVGLLPGIGLPFAIVTIADFFRVRRQSGSLWNPAERYLACGFAAAVGGVLLTILLAFALAIQLS